MINYNTGNDILNTYFATVTEKIFSNSYDYLIYTALVDLFVNGETNQPLTEKNYRELLHLAGPTDFKTVLDAAERINDIDFITATSCGVEHEKLIPLEIFELDADGEEQGRAVRFKGVPAVCKKRDVLYFISKHPLEPDAQHPEENAAIEDYMLQHIVANTQTSMQVNQIYLSDLLKKCGIEPTKENRKRVHEKLDRLAAFYIENGLIDGYDFT